MKITIVGCDKIGSAILDQAIKDEHSVCVVDIDPRRVKRAYDKYEIRGAVGNGASCEVLRKAGADKCDLVIAATNVDEVNILSCAVARNLGAKHTIAINNDNKYIDQISNFRDHFGISMSISPEKVSAGEAARMLRFPSALQVELFAEGRMELVEVVIQDDSDFAGCTIAEKHGRLFPDVQICAIERDGEVIIPSGDSRLLAGDRLNLVSTASGIARYLKSAKRYQPRIKNVMILGGGYGAHCLAERIIASGMRVTIVESDEERCRHLSEEFPKAVVIRGMDNDYELMRKEGLASADAFVSFTDNNEKNIIASLYARSKNVGKVITRVDEHNLFSVVNELDIGGVVSPNVLAATRILHFMKGLQSAQDLGSKLDAIYSLSGSDAYVLEFRVNAGFAHCLTPIRALKLKSDTIIAMIIRNRETLIPRGDDYIADGDTVIVVTRQKQVGGINDIIAE